MKKTFSPWLAYCIPLIWFFLGVVYARSLDAWSGIGVLILVVISTVGLLAGVITWHVTRNYWKSIIIGLLAIVSFFVFVMITARFG